jgi:hypothetical protein
MTDDCRFIAAVLGKVMGFARLNPSYRLPTYRLLCATLKGSKKPIPILRVQSETFFEENHSPKCLFDVTSLLG